MCAPSAGDTLLRAGGSELDRSRFCFFECKPAEGPTSPAASACVALSAEDRAHLAEGSGNAKDPATLSFLQLAPSPAADAEAEAMASAARAQADATRAVASELRSQQANEAVARAERLDAPDPLAGIASIREDEGRAERAAQAAQAEAGTAEETVLKARTVALEGGVQAGKSAMEEVKAADIKAAHDLAAFRDKLVNKQEMKAIAAAMKAAEPFQLSMWRAQKTVSDYSTQAQTDMKKAKALQTEATALAEKANAASDRAAAASVYEQAQQKAAEAAQYASNAKAAFATADDLNKGIPKYQGAAQAAAARAAFDSMPAWQPAPAPPFPAFAAR